MADINRNNTTRGSIVKRNSNTNQWFMNVAKSLGYTSTELVTNLMPSMSDFVMSNKDYTIEMVKDMREATRRGGRIGRFFGESKEMSTINDAFRNAIDDISSGKIYNKERVDKMQSEGMDFDLDMDQMDFDFDGSFDEEGFDDPEAGPIKEKKPVPNIKLNVHTTQAPITKDSPIIAVMERNTKALYETGIAGNDTALKIHQQNAMINYRHHSQSIEGIQTINDNVSLLVNFANDSLAKYVGASLKYYEDSLGILTQSLEELKGGNTQQKQAASPDLTYDVFLSSGGLNVQGYTAMVRKNLKEAFSSNMFLSTLKNFWDDDTMLKTFAASPLSFLSTKIVSTLVPTMLQNTMKQVDSSFSNFFPALMMRINRETLDNSNPILNFLGEIFGVNVKTKSTINMANYEKGRVPFDGIVRKSIVEVIPGYLKGILAAVSGQQEITMDFETGKFVTTASLQEEFDRRRDYTVTNAFGETIDKIRNLSDTFIMASSKDREVFQKGIDKFFINLSKNNKLINPFATDRDGNELNELNDVYDFEGNSNMQRIFAQVVRSMDNSSRMKMFGTDVMTARRESKQLMERYEEDPYVGGIYALFNRDSSIKSDTHLTKNTSGAIVGKKGTPFNPTDTFGLTALDYLRTISMTLARGINVFSAGDTVATAGATTNTMLFDSSKLDQGLSPWVYAESQERDKQKAYIKAKKSTVTKYSDKEVSKLAASGRSVLNDVSDLDMTDEEIYNQILAKQDIDAAKNNKPKKSILNKLGGMFKGDAKDRYNSIAGSIEDLLQKPAEMLQGVVSRIDRTLHDIVFGSNKTGDQSFMSTFMSRMNLAFNRMIEWTDAKVLSPIHEKFFGKEGLFTKFKESEFNKGLKQKFGNVVNFVFGKKTGLNGEREGGLLSETANEFSDMWSGVRHYFTGKGYINTKGQSIADNKENSVFGEVQKMFGGFKDTMKEYLFGRKKEGEEEKSDKGVIGGIYDTLKSGFNNFSEALFGPKGSKGSTAKTSEEMIAAIKERTPKSLAYGIVGSGAGLLLGGKLGLLGSLLLPGGPIGGAIVGTTVGFLTQSDRFKNWMFGEKDVLGERQGGVISKSFQDYFKNNKAGIVGGATLGAVKSITGFGILPGFLMPGGPIGGAILGAAVSMGVKSEAFQKFMFGEKDPDGNRTGGIIKKLFKADGDGKTKKLLGNVSVGALGGAGIGLVTSKMGIMGAMLLPGGPIGGAILGAAAGIALTSDRWKKAVFGEWDEEKGRREGGLIGKFQNWFQMEIVKPMGHYFKGISLSIKDWFAEKIANPFQLAIAPIKKSFNDMTDKMTDMFKNGWESFKDKIGNVFEVHVGKPFGHFMTENVMKPLKGFFSRMLKGIGTIFGSIISAPFKALGAYGENLTEKDKSDGLKEYRKFMWASLFSAEAKENREMTGEKLKFRDIVNVIRSSYFDKEKKEAAENRGAPYLAEQQKILDQQEEARQARQQARVNWEQEGEKLGRKRRLAAKADYENTFAGADIARIYGFGDPSRKGIDNGRRIKDVLGLGVMDIFGEAVDVNALNERQRSLLGYLSSTGLKGDDLKVKLNEFMAKYHEKKDVAKTEPPAATPLIGESAKDGTEAAIEKSLVPEVKKTNDLLRKIASQLGAKVDNIRSVNPRNIGALKRLVKTRKKKDDETNSHADGLDNVPHDEYNTNLHQGEMVIPADQANEVRRAAGVSTEKESPAGGNVLVNSIGDAKKGSRTEPVALLRRITEYTKITAREVNGQLDGVGGNVFRIRKLMEKMLDGFGLGASESDDLGSGNRDRKGFMGKLRGWLFKPLETMRDTLMKGVFWVTDKVKAVGDSIVRFGKAIIDIPVQMAKVGWQLTKEVGNIVKQSLLSVVKIPQVLIEGVVTTIQAAVPALGEAALSVVKLVSGAAGMLANGLIGFGKGVGNVLEATGKGLGKIINSLSTGAANLIQGFGKIVGAAGKLAADITATTLKATAKLVTTGVDFTLKTVKMIADKFMDIGNSLLNIVTAPLKFIGSMAGKILKTGPTETKVIGGSIDRIGRLENFQDLISLSKKDPLRVIIAGTEDRLPVFMTNEAERQITVLPVKVENINEMSGATTNIETDNKSSILDGFNSGIDKLANMVMGNKAAEEKKAARAKVTRKTAEYQKEILAEADQKEFERESQERQIALLEKISESTTEHKNEWMHIFGRKGVLALAALTALPYLKDIYNWVKGFFGGDSGGLPSLGKSIVDAVVGLGENKERRTYTDEEGNERFISNDAYRETLGRSALGTYNNAAKKVFRDKDGKLNVTQAVDRAKNIGAKVTTVATDFLNTTSMGTKIKTKAVEVATAATIRTSVLKENITDLATKIKSAMNDVLEKFSSNKTIQGKLGSDGSGKMFSSLKSLFDKILTNEFIAKYAPQLMKGTAKTVAKGAVAFATGGISVAVFAVWDSVTGAIEAANLFKVNEKEVTVKMRLAAAVVKALMGFIPIISIIAELVAEWMGFDLKQEVGILIHNAIADTGQVAALDEAIDSFEAEWKESGLDISLNAYNDLQNKTAIGKVKESYKDFKTGVGTVLKAGPIGNIISSAGTLRDDDKIRSVLGKSTDENITFMDRMIATGSTYAKNATFGLLDDKTVANTASVAWDWTKDKTKGAVDWTKNTASKVGDWTKDRITDAKDVTSKAVDWTKDKVSNVKAATNKAIDWTKGKVSDAWNSEPMTIVRNVSEGVWSYVTSVTSALANGAGTIADAVKTRIGKIVDGVGESWQKYVSDPVNDFIDKLGTNLGAVKDLVSSLWESKVTQPVDKFMDNVTDKWNESKAKVSEFWEEKISKPVDKFASSIGYAFDLTKQFVSDKFKDWVLNPLNSVGDSISNGFNAVKNVVSGVIREYIAEPFQTMVDTMTVGIETVVNWLGDKWNSLKEFTGNLWKNGKEVTGNVVKKATGSAKNTVTSLYDKAVKATGNLKSSLSSSGNSTANSIDSLTRKLADFIGGAGGPAYEVKQTTPTVAHDDAVKFFSGYRVSSHYGNRTHPVTGEPNKFHSGIDLVQGLNSPITSFSQGKVIKSGDYGSRANGTGFGGLGKTVVVQDEHGANHVYGHMNSLKATVGDTVKPGDLLGYEGNTGISSGPHLHYEVRTGGPGTSVDPTAYLSNYLSGAGIDIKSLGINSSGVAMNEEDAIKALGVFGVFDKMSEATQLYVNNMLTGSNDRLSFDTSSGTDSISGASYMYNGAPVTNNSVRDAIAQKTTELILKGEGSPYHKVTADFNASTKQPAGMSIGLMQWNKSRARAMLKEVHNKYPSMGFNTYTNRDAFWNNNWWNSADVQNVTGKLKAVPGAEQVQREVMTRDINNINLAPIYKSGKLKDPRSIALLAEIGNTGPAHITSFLNKYSAPSSGESFDHFYGKLTSNDSYWGKNKGVYGNRLKSAYDNLKNWTPDVKEDDAGGAGGPALDVKAIATPKTLGGGYTESYRQLNSITSNMGKGGPSDEELLATAIELLSQIASNTKDTSANTKNISNEIIVISSNNTNNTTNKSGDSANTTSTTTNKVTVNSSGGYVNNPLLSAMTSLNDDRLKSEYTRAKLIASGRVQ